jgi:energy-converting hydrogenase Eha subunit F
MNPLGDNLLAWLVLAFGGAMSIGTLVAILRPPEAPRPAPRSSSRAGAPVATRAKGGTPPAAPARQIPMARAVVFIAVGGLAAAWALASLLAS